MRNVSIFCLLVSLLTFSQVKAIDIYGTIVLEDGSKVSGVIVTITGGEIGNWSTLSTEDGSFRFSALPHGAYSLSFEKRGFKTITGEDIEIQPEQAYQCAVNMQSGLIHVEITTAGKSNSSGRTIVSLNQATELTGIWKSNTGLTYEIIHRNNHFSWTVRGGDEKGEITIGPDQIHSEWHGSRSSGSASGIITERDIRGRPIQIKWSDGVIFNKVAKGEPSTILDYMLILSMKMISEQSQKDLIINSSILRSLEEMNSQLEKIQSNKIGNKIEKVIEKQKILDVLDGLQALAKVMIQLKQLCIGLSKMQMQQLAKIPQGFGFSIDDSKTIVEGIIGGFAGAGKIETNKAAIGLIHLMSKKDASDLILSLMTAVAKMKGYNNLFDAFS